MLVSWKDRLEQVMSQDVRRPHCEWGVKSKVSTAACAATRQATHFFWSLAGWPGSGSAGRLPDMGSEPDCRRSKGEVVVGLRGGRARASPAPRLVLCLSTAMASTVAHPGGSADCRTRVRKSVSLASCLSD